MQVEGGDVLLAARVEDLEELHVRMPLRRLVRVRVRARVRVRVRVRIRVRVRVRVGVNTASRV